MSLNSESQKRLMKTGPVAVTADHDCILRYTDRILITGSNGFIGSRVVKTLLKYGYTKLRCLVRPSSNLAALERIARLHPSATIDIVKGNLLSNEDCKTITNGVCVVYHLAAGRGEKSFPDAFLNSVVTTRNLLEAVREAKASGDSSISARLPSTHPAATARGLLDESCEVERKPHLRGEAYCYAKVRQEELLLDYGERYHPVCDHEAGRRVRPGEQGHHRQGRDRHVRTFSPYGRLQQDPALLCGELRGCDSARRAEGRRRRRSLQRGRRRSAHEQEIFGTVQKAREAVLLALAPAAGQLRALLPLGTILGVVRGAAAPGIQPQTVGERLERAYVYQRETENAARLEAEHTARSGAERYFAYQREGEGRT